MQLIVLKKIIDGFIVYASLRMNYQANSTSPLKVDYNMQLIVLKKIIDGFIVHFNGLGLLAKDLSPWRDGGLIEYMQRVL